MRKKQDGTPTMTTATHYTLRSPSGRYATFAAWGALVWGERAEATRFAYMTTAILAAIWAGVSGWEVELV